MPLAAFGADAFDFLLVVVVNFIEIAIVIMLKGRQGGCLEAFTGLL